jgi:hypothetical protein
MSLEHITPKSISDLLGVPSFVASRYNAPDGLFALGPQHSHGIRVGKEGELPPFKMVRFPPSLFPQSLLELLWSIRYCLVFLEMATEIENGWAINPFVMPEIPDTYLTIPRQRIAGSHFLLSPSIISRNLF